MRPGRRSAAVCCLWATLGASPRPAWAQAGFAELTGAVRSPDGAAVPDCRVTATELATGHAVSVTTSRQGLFTLFDLRPGSYRIEAGASGFQPGVRKGVQLVTGERVRIDFTLAVGTFTEAATVTADAALLQTE